MCALILFIHVGFLEYLSFKQFKLIVKMTRIESGVTIPKGLFTLYFTLLYNLLVCQESDGLNFLAAIVHAQKNKTFNKHLTSKLQFSPNFTLNSVADSNYRGNCDVGGFLIFEWTLFNSVNLTF
jgi:hypothetical protein